MRIFTVNCSLRDWCTMRLVRAVLGKGMIPVALFDVLGIWFDAPNGLLPFPSNAPSARSGVNVAPSAECRQGPAGSCLCTQWHSSGGNSGCPLPCAAKCGMVLHLGGARRDVRNRGLCVIAVWVCSTSCAMQSESPAAAYARAYRARV